MNATPNNYDTHAIAAEEARKIILEHLTLCPFAKFDIEARVRTIEKHYAALVGFMVGSGLLGGAAGALLSKVLGP
jgi:hypothetical protein